MRKRMNPNSLLNLRPFNTIPPDEAREIQSMGGKASGEKRRQLAEAVDTFNDAFLLISMRSETREHYQAAIRKYAAAEARKRKRRKPKARDE